MCVPYSQRAPRTRRQRFVANLTLVAGLLLWSFVLTSNLAPHPWRPWITVLTGLLLSISIGVNSEAHHRGSRCQAAETQKL